MLDSSVTKQDELNNKLTLLKQIKVILETLMFDNQSFSGRSSWQNFSGTMTIFARHILSILEDGISIVDLPVDAQNSKFPLFESPVSSSFSSVNFRSSTMSSNHESIRSFSDATLSQENAVWLFITNTLNLNVEFNENEILKSKMTMEEKSAMKDFKAFYGSIQDENQSSGVNRKSSTSRKMSTLSSISIHSNSDQCNLPLEWITYSLRQNVLLNQLIFLLGSESHIRNYYKSSAFVLDRSFVEDFFNYLRAYELRDFTILSKVKRNFFDIKPKPGSITQKEIVNKSRNNSRNENSLTTQVKTLQLNSPKSPNIPLPITKSNISISPTSSRASSVTTNGYQSGASSFSSNIGKNQSVNDDFSLYNDSIVEHAVKEVNNLTLKRHAKSHRRMFSVPNIQINHAKRNSMTVTTTANNNASVNNHNASQLLNSNQSFKTNFIDCELKISSLLTDSNEVKEEPKIKSGLVLSNDAISIPTLNLNNESMGSNDEKNECNEIFQCSPPASPNHVNPSPQSSPDIYKKTSVFDFIHSQQINLECSQLDKENSHFIIADISISAFELMKTQELADSVENTEAEFIKDLSTKQKTRKASNVIKINNNLINCFRQGRPRKNDSPSNLASPNTTAQLDDFATTSMACSMEQELIYASGFTSPNSELQSVSSSVNAFAKIEDTESFIISPAQKLYNTQSLASLESNNEEESTKKNTIVKSASSTDLPEIKQSNQNNESEFTNDERISTLREKWLMAARKIVINQNHIKKNDISNTDSSNVLPIISQTNQLNDNEDQNSIKTDSSETSGNLKQVSNRTRRFSWEEIINLDTAEHISTRLIERLIDSKTNSISKRNKCKISIPNLRQFDYLIQYLEYYENMQTYYQLRSSKNLEKYLIESMKKPTAQHNQNGLKTKQSNTLTKIKTAAVAAAAAVSINHEKDFNKVEDSTSFNSIDNESGKKNLIRQILFKSNNLIPNKKKHSLDSSMLENNLHKTLNARIIGDESWAPVRDQLILNQSPKQKRLDQMVIQNFRCADCGIQVRRDKIKSFNYCEYFGKYFCRCCHINNQSYIPAYVINSNDFRIRYEVSKKAKNFLEKIYTEPVITLESLNPQLFERSSTLAKIKKLRLKLYCCRMYINSCRFATELNKQLYNQFDDFIINDQHVYSIETLFKIKKTYYYDDLKTIVNQIIEHIKNCELCSQQGYICGMCNNNELLYPFELEKVEKCSDCLTCYHKNCFKIPENCPRCKRKRNRIRSNTSARESLTSS